MVEGIGEIINPFISTGNYTSYSIYMLMSMRGLYLSFLFSDYSVNVVPFYISGLQ
jgi:hypothetical protein